MASLIDHPLPPQDREAEQRLLGLILANNRAINDVAPILASAETFYSFGHQRIFEAMLTLISHGKPADVVTVCDALKLSGHLEDAGGPGYIAELWNERGNSVSQAVAYAEIIRNRYVARRLLTVAAELRESAFTPGSTSSDLIESAERSLFGFASLAASGEVVPQSQAVREYLTTLDRRDGENADASAQPVETRWAKLDATIVGFHPGELALVGARPGVGKSVFCLNLAVRVARHGAPVLFVALEQSRDEQINRQIAQHSGINSWSLRRGVFKPEEKDSILNAADQISPLPIFYDDQPCQTLARIGANVRRLKAKEGLRLVIIDYLQLIDGGNNPREPRHEVVGRISRYLKILARETKVPIVAAAQVNRGSEERSDKRPKLSDLRESGSLEQDADTVLLLHKPDPPDSTRAIDTLEIEIAKSRNGPTDRIALCHRKAQFEICDFMPGSFQ